MTKQRRSFSIEFKREAAALVLDQGYSRTLRSAWFFTLTEWWLGAVEQARC